MKCQKLAKIVSITLFLAAQSLCGYASEISFVSGGLKSETTKDATSELDVFEVSLSGRYLERNQYDSESAAYYYGGISVYSYDGTTAPNDSLGLTLGIGSRFYGSEFTPRIRPYLSLYGEVETSEVYFETGSRTVETTGINYGMILGFKFDFYENIFFELESNIFQGSLMRSTTVETPGGETETTAYELFASTSSEYSLGMMSIGIGMVL